ncbi:hypothetical protein HDU97_000521 [Phlyctochytrium planicorne]|nr:hypothetical protein HDU97_000521 [Phlyctochytrium planicorne]
MGGGTSPAETAKSGSNERMSMSPERPASGLAAMLRASRKTHHVHNAQQQVDSLSPDPQHDTSPTRRSIDHHNSSGRPVSPSGRGFKFSSLKIRSPKQRSGFPSNGQHPDSEANDGNVRTPEPGEPPLSPTLRSTSPYPPMPSGKGVTPSAPGPSLPIGTIMKRLPSVSSRRGSGGNGNHGGSQSFGQSPQSPSRMLSNSSLISNRIPSSDSIKSGPGPGGSTPLSASSSANSLLSTSPSRRTSTSNNEVRETQKLVRDFDPSTGNKMINKYMIVKELGRGVHGKVKLSVDVETGDLWAIKIVEKHARRRFQNRFALSQRNGENGEDASNPQLEKIKREIAILKKLDHPHVVKLREVIDDPEAEKIYLVLEYLAGRDIKWQDRSEPPKPCQSIDNSRKILRDVVCGLEYLHHQGIVHRDIKPANLLWTAEKRVKISDFGVSVFVGSGKSEDPLAKKSADEVELAKTAGSPAFFAPELCAVPDEDFEAIRRDLGFGPNEPKSSPLSKPTSHLQPPLPPSPLPSPLEPKTPEPQSLSHEFASEPNLQAESSRPSMAWLQGFRRYHSPDKRRNSMDDEDENRRKDTKNKQDGNDSETNPPSVSRTLSSPGTTPHRRRSAFSPTPSSSSSAVDLANHESLNQRRHSQPNAGASFPYTPPPVPPPPIPAQYQNKKLVGRKSLQEENLSDPMIAGSAIDVWALGVTLFCFVFGKVPFIAETEFELFHVICRQLLEFPADPAINDSLKDLFSRLLDKNPHTRIKLHEVKKHPWTTEDMTPAERADWLRDTDPSLSFGSPLSVTAEEVSGAVHVLFMDRIKEKFRKLSTNLQSAMAGAVAGFKKKSKSLPSVSSEASESQTHISQEHSDTTNVNAPNQSGLASPSIEASFDYTPVLSPLSPFSPLSISGFEEKGVEVADDTTTGSSIAKRGLAGSRESGIEIIVEGAETLEEPTTPAKVTPPHSLHRQKGKGYSALLAPPDGADADDDEDFDSGTDGQPSPATTWIRWGDPIVGQPSWMNGMVGPTIDPSSMDIPEDSFVEMAKDDNSEQRRRRWQEKSRRTGDLSSGTSSLSGSFVGITMEDVIDEEQSQVDQGGSGEAPTPPSLPRFVRRSRQPSEESRDQAGSVGGRSSPMGFSKAAYTASPATLTPSGSSATSLSGVLNGQDVYVLRKDEVLDPEISEAAVASKVLPQVPVLPMEAHSSGFQGGLSFLISSITGPEKRCHPDSAPLPTGRMVLVSLDAAVDALDELTPVTPTIVFIAIAFLSGMSSLFLIEAMTYFPGNKHFQRNVEFTVLVHHFYGKRWYYLMHIVLSGFLQSLNIASVIAAVQNFDTSVSMIYMFFVALAWSVLAVVNGVDPEKLPTLGPQLSIAPTAVIGQVLFNFTIANTIPSWVNTKRNLVLQQSVLDELENLEIDGAVRKRGSNLEDDFDYVYHLPHADLPRLGARRYDPIAKLAGKTAEAAAKEKPQISVPVVAMQASNALIQSVRKQRPKILELGINNEGGLSAHKGRRGSNHLTAGGGSHINLTGSNLGIPGAGAVRSRRTSAFGGGGSSANLTSSNSNMNASALIQFPNGRDAQNRRVSMLSFQSKKVNPEDVDEAQGGDRSTMTGRHQSIAGDGDTDVMINADNDDGTPGFKALPQWITQRRLTSPIHFHPTTQNSGFQGGLSFLIGSITGPGVIQIPILYQQAGWFLPTIVFFAIAFLSGMSSLFLIEAMTYFPGNKHFQRNVEFTVLVHHFYGKRWYYLMHIVLYGSLQSFNIASVVAAVQNFDTFLLSTLGKTCGFGFSPISGFYCVAETSGQSSPFGSNYMLITAGGIVFACIMIPLLNLNLDDNMIFQWVSLVYMMIIVVCWSVLAMVHGVDPAKLPTLGPQLSIAPTAVIGQVLFNFTIANTVPSWVNTKHPKVSIHKTIWASVYGACAIYIITGIFGALGFDLPDGSDLLSALSLQFTEGSAGNLVKFISLTYPILILLTSIPVSFIVVKLNLITSRICNRDWANFWSTIFPILICIPFQTGPFIGTFTSWSSLIFQSLCNFVAPFLIFIFLDKRNLVLQQSVLDELENLDIDGAIRKRGSKDDDFDYVYHLPHADLTRLGPRRYDPFAKLIEKTSGAGIATTAKEKPQISVPVVAMEASNASLQSARKQGAKILDLGINSDGGLTAHKGRRGSNHLTAGGGSHINLAGSNLGIPGAGAVRSRRTSAFGGGGSSVNLNSSNGNMNGSALIHVPNGFDAQNRRVSMGSFQSKKVHPEGEDGAQGGDRSTMNGRHRSSVADGGTDVILNAEDDDDVTPGFKALPQWVTQRIPSRVFAIVCFVLTFGLALTVILYDFVLLGMGQAVF